MVLAFSNAGSLPQATVLNIPRQDDDIYSAGLDSLVWEVLISLLGLLQLLPETLLFLRKNCEFQSLFRPLTVDLFLS